MRSSWEPSTNGLNSANSFGSKIESIFANTHTILKISETVVSFGNPFHSSISSALSRLRDLRSSVISSFIEHFTCKILKKNDLLTVSLDHKHVKKAIVSVPKFNKAIHSICALPGVPVRVIPQFRSIPALVNYSLGKSFLNEQTDVGFANIKQSNILFCGSNKKLLYGSMQHFMKNLLSNDMNVIVLDLMNEFSGLIDSITDNSIPKSLYQLGRNLLLNLCTYDLPSKFKMENIFHIARHLIYALASINDSYDMQRNLPSYIDQVESLMQEGNLKEITMADLVPRLTDKESPSSELMSNERLIAELRQYSIYPELNYSNYAKIFDPRIPTEGLTIIQFPDQTNSVKILATYFLLQKLATKCSDKTIVVLSHCDLLFSKTDTRNKSPSQIFEDSIGQFIKQIISSGLLICSSQNPSRIPTYFFNQFDNYVVYHLNNDYDRNQITQRFNLGSKKSVATNSLRYLSHEGLIFRSDCPESIYHFTPFIDNSVQTSIKPLPKDSFDIRISDSAFIALMYSIDFLKDKTLFDNEVEEYLESLNLHNAKNVWKTILRLNYFETEGKEGRQVVKVKKAGFAYQEEFLKIVNKLPPPIDPRSKNVDNYIFEMNDEAFNTNDEAILSKIHTDINTLAGGLLNIYFSYLNHIDWGVFNLYLTLLNIKGIFPRDFTLRFEYLNTIMETTKIYLRKLPYNEVDDSNQQKERKSLSETKTMVFAPPLDQQKVKQYDKRAKKIGLEGYPKNSLIDIVLMEEENLNDKGLEEEE